MITKKCRLKIGGGADELNICKLFTDTTSSYNYFLSLHIRRLLVHIIVIVIIMVIIVIIITGTYY